MNIKETKKSIIQAGQIAVNELIKVAEQNLLDGKSPEEKKERVFKGFAEGRSK
jgi:hypothetical protein